MAGLSRCEDPTSAATHHKLHQLSGVRMTAAADWAGRVGDVWAAEWRRTDRAFAALVPHLDAAILAAAPPGPFTALDIGSGAGATAIALARARADASVIGVDLSAPLVAVARDRAAGLPNCRFQQGEVITFAGSLRPNLLVSRHGVMFFPDPVSALAALRRVAGSGAHLVFTCFAAPTDNLWATLATSNASPASGRGGAAQGSSDAHRRWKGGEARGRACPQGQPVAGPVAVLPEPLEESRKRVSTPSIGYTPGPFAFADPDATRALLAAAGWTGTVRRIDFAYRVGAGEDPVADALSFLTRIGPAASALRNAPDRAAMVDRLRNRLEQQRTGDVIDFPAAAWLWSVRA